MADFRTHISVSTLTGIAYGGAGYSAGIPLSTCLVAAGLCSISGMLPDLDSESSIPVREIMSLVAAVVPALMIPRFEQFGLNTEQMVLVAGAMYLAIRFGVSEVFKSHTVHRGMWHSIPAAVIAGLLAFLIVSGTEIRIRLFKSAAVVIGFLVHLVLDEMWSLDVRHGRLRVKRSFGTALKFWKPRGFGVNFLAYGQLLLLLALVVGDPFLMDQLGFEQPEFAQRPTVWMREVVERGGQWLPVLSSSGGREVAPAPLVDSPHDDVLDRMFDSDWRWTRSEQTARWSADDSYSERPIYR